MARPNRLSEALRAQHRDHPHWSYQLHHDNLVAWGEDRAVARAGAVVHDAASLHEGARAHASEEETPGRSTASRARSCAPSDAQLRSDAEWFLAIAALSVIVHQTARRHEAQFAPPPPASQCHGRASWLGRLKARAAVATRHRCATYARRDSTSRPSRSTPRATTHCTGHGIVAVDGSPLELLSDVRFDARVNQAALPGATSGQAPRIAMRDRPIARHSRRRLAEGGQGSHGES